MFETLLAHSPLLYLTQSLWRDEAFSILAAERSLGFILTKIGFEPPLYYWLLHFWTRIFGQSEIAARSLSFIAFVLATIIVIEWSSRSFKKHWLAIFTPVFFFLNPMLLYYAFEVRTYGWYVLFATAAALAYAKKSWKWFVITSILGFYTHAYFLLLLAALGTHWLIIERPTLKLSLKFLWSHQPFRSFVIIGAACIPWIIRILGEAARLKSSWYYPVDLQLIYSVLGNMFVGYEGTPWFGWQYTKYLSILLLGCIYLALRDKEHKHRNVLLVWIALVPLVICIGISFIKPLFVNRYLIPVTVAEVLIVIAAIQAIKHKLLQYGFAAVMLAMVLWVNWWYPSQHAKQPIRDTMIQVNTMKKDTDVILAASPIIYLEVKYYAKNRNQVYLYNPNQGVFPWYIGDALVSQTDMVRDFPLYPTRAFLVHDDGNFEIVYRMPMVKQSSTLGQ